jgi:hypothetical protein
MSSPGFTIASSATSPPAVILVPGAHYDVKAPLFVALIDALRARDLGWVSIAWTDDDRGNNLNAWRGVITDAVRAAAHAASPDAVIVAKSVGTLAVESANALGLRGVWWTPTVGPAAESTGFGPAVRTALESRTVSDLLIGGTADALWASAAIPNRHHVVEFPNANHGLEIAGDAKATEHVRESVVNATLEWGNFIC